VQAAAGVNAGKKPVRVTVKVNDSEGDEGTGERMVTLSDTILLTLF
jgi:hypothetical protein